MDRIIKLFENDVKTLKNANIKTVMVTGDNILTAIAVSNDVGLTNTNSSNSTVYRPVINDFPGTNGKCSLSWRNTVTNELHEHIKLNENEDYELAITGNEFKWIQNNRPELMDYILVKGTHFYFKTRYIFYC